MLKIGWSKRDVSTQDPVMITGQFHVRVSRGVLDPIMLYCLVLDDGNDQVIFLSGDFMSPGNVLNDIRAQVVRRMPGFPAEKIIFNVTHTHCGPGIMKTSGYSAIPHEGLEIADPGEYYVFLVNSAADTILEAWDARAEGAISYGYGYAVVSHSRRTTYQDDFSLRGVEEGKYQTYKSLIVNGHAVMYGSTNDDRFNGYEGGADHYVNLLYTFDTEGRLTGAIINVPCPSQNSEMESLLTADFWHDVRTELKKTYGDIFLLSQCAAAGDLSPRTLHYKKAEARRYALKYGPEQRPMGCEHAYELFNRKDICQRICAAFDEVYSWATRERFTDLPLRHQVQRLQLQRWMIREDEYLYAKEELAALEAGDYTFTGKPLEDFHANSIRMTSMNRFRDIIARYEAQQISATEAIEVHTVRVGDIAFATNPFELYLDFQHRIQARSPFIQTFIVQLCANSAGNYSYLATDRGEKNVGYSANIFSNRISSQGGDTFVEKTLDALNRLMD